MASHLQEFEANEINKAIFQQKWKLVERLKCQINWGPPADTLPIYSWSDYEALCINHGGSRHLICISGVIYDVERFIESHPGGKALLVAHIGKDATASFHGGVYKRKYSYTAYHFESRLALSCSNELFRSELILYFTDSKAASNLLDNMRFGVVRGGGQVEEASKR